MDGSEEGDIQTMTDLDTKEMKTPPPRAISPENTPIEELNSSAVLRLISRPFPASFPHVSSKPTEVGIGNGTIEPTLPHCDFAHAFRLAYGSPVSAEANFFSTGQTKLVAWNIVDITQGGEYPGISGGTYDTRTRPANEPYERWLNLSAPTDRARSTIR
jgi:hypothetical protein